MTILSSFPAARAVSASLSATLMVMGFNNGVFVVSSKAFVGAGELRRQNWYLGDVKGGISQLGRCAHRVGVQFYGNFSIGRD